MAPTSETFRPVRGTTPFESRFYSTHGIAASKRRDYNGRSNRGGRDGALRQGSEQDSGECSAAREERDAQIGQGRQRRTSQNSQAGDCHRAVGSAQEGREGSAEEV